MAYSSRTTKQRNAWKRKQHEIAKVLNTKYHQVLYMIDCDSAVHLGFYETGLSSAMHAGLIDYPDNTVEILCRHIEQEEQHNIILDRNKVKVFTYSKHAKLVTGNPEGIGFWCQFSQYQQGNIGSCAKDYPGLSEVF